MVETFEVTEAQRAFVEELVEVTLDFGKKAYYLAAYATDLDAARREGGFMGLWPPPRELPAFPDAAPVVPKPPA